MQFTEVHSKEIERELRECLSEVQIWRWMDTLNTVLQFKFPKYSNDSMQQKGFQILCGQRERDRTDRSYPEIQNLGYYLAYTVSTNT